MRLLYKSMKHYDSLIDNRTVNYLRVNDYLLKFFVGDRYFVDVICDRIMVMNKGEIVELDTAESIYTNPKQPYTQKLISAIPKALVFQ